MTFADLSEEAKADFSGYVRHGRLVVTARAEWDPEKQQARVLQYGQRLGMPAFKPFFEAEGAGAKVADLKAVYERARETYPDLPTPKTKDQMVAALREYEAARPDACVLIPSRDQFYGFSSGKNLMDRHLQWVYLPAVKEASTEQSEGKSTALGKLLARTVRSKVAFSDRIKDIRSRMEEEYLSLIDGSQEILDDISTSLNRRLQQWAHPGASMVVGWDYDKDKSIRIDEPLASIRAGEGVFTGEFARLGHGLQRSLMLSLLEELSAHEEEGAPTLLLGIEEPELFQHPPQARYLAEILRKLSVDGAQVLVCSHSPFFVSGESFENVRLVRKDPSTHASSVKQISLEDLAGTLAAATGGPPAVRAATLVKLHQVLQPALNEIFFASTVVLVEGPEDSAYISAHMQMSGRWEDFRRYGCHIVSCQNKTGIIRPKAICDLFGIPTFVVFDSDGDKYGDPAKDKNGNRAKHEKDNTALLRLCGHASEDPFGPTTLWKGNMVMWPGDIGAAVEADCDAPTYQAASSKVSLDYGNAGNIKKDELYIGDLLIELTESGQGMTSLERLCQSIIEYAKANSTLQLSVVVGQGIKAVAVPAVA